MEQVEPPDLELESFLASPPTLGEVLKDPLLYQVFHWHLVSRFAPENLMFRTAVQEYQASIKKGDLKEARDRLKVIEARYMGDDSAFEVNRQARKEKLSDLPDNQLTDNVFDQVLQQIDKDLGRSLQTLWASSVFRVFIKHRATLNQLNQVGPISPALGSSRGRGPAGVAQQIQLEVRAAYGSQSPLRLQRHFEVGSPYPYKLTQKDTDALVGYARQTGEQFCFFDLQEKEVLQVSAIALLGQQTAAVDKTEVDDDVAGSGCCSPAQPRSRSSTASGGAVLAAKAGWYLQAQNGNELGPIPYTDLQVLWKYHLVPESTPARQAGEFVPMKEQPQFFSPASQIQHVDPTLLE